jgi:peptidoglycan/LPS O-acetylase OafA/YrhL
VDQTIGTAFLWLLARLFDSAHALYFTPWQIHDWELAVGGLVLCAFVYGAYRHPQSFPAVCIWWSALFLVPFALLPEHIATFNQGPSHYLYPASAGAAMLLAWLLGRIGRYGHSGQLGGALLLLALVGRCLGRT